VSPISFAACKNPRHPARASVPPTLIRRTPRSAASVTVTVRSCHLFSWGVLDTTQAEPLPASGSVGDSDEGQRDVVMAAGLDRCLPQLEGGPTVLGLLE
jgi:hypothetical protein